MDDLEGTWAYMPQRMMTDADQAALRAMLAFYTPRIANRGTIPAIG